MLLLLIIALATLGAFLPPTIVFILTLLLSRPIPAYIIIGSSEWVTVISIVISAYFGANVYQKHSMMSNGLLPNDLKNELKKEAAENKKISEPLEKD